MFGLPEPYDSVARGILLACIAVLWTVFLVRVVGLRAFSKMTAFDFVTTVATGSLIAQAATREELAPFLQSLAAIGGVFLIQYLLSLGRQSSGGLQRLIKNQPVLLMENGSFLEEAIAQTRVSRANIIEKLRAADVSGFAEVRAVVLETTGDISVLKRGDDDELLEGVRRVSKAEN